MPINPTYGRYPTLGEMREYYQRPEVLDFFWEECQLRNVFMALDGKTWEIQPQSRDQLRQLIDQAIDERIAACNRKRAQREGVPVDQLRLKLYEYLSFHSAEVLSKGERIVGFDMIFEPDLVGWRRSFEELTGVVDLLESFDICYRIKYSGVRSLHLIIPHEAIPTQFMGKQVRFYRDVLMKRLQRYFSELCGLKNVDKPGFLRLAYSLNEDNGLVSLPLDPARLADFRPWQAHLHQVRIERPWHGQVPAGASRRTLALLRQVFDQTREPPAKGYSFGLEIRPRLAVSAADTWRTGLEAPDTRVRAAWEAMVAGHRLDERFLADEHDDVRWYATESLQAQLDAQALDWAGRMMADADALVRISAGDTLILAGQQPDRQEEVFARLVGLLEAGRVSTSGLLDVLYVLYKICQHVPGPETASRVGGLVAGVVEQSVASDEKVNWDMWAGQMAAQCRRYDFDALALLGPTLVLCLEGLGAEDEAVAWQHYVVIVRKLYGYEKASQIGLDEIARRLQGAIAVEDEEQAALRALVAQTLERLDQAALGRILLALLRDGHLDVRLRAGEILRHQPHLEQWAAERLRGWLAAEEAAVRANAARALGEMAGTAGIDALVGALGDEDHVVRQSLVEALGALGAPAVAALLPLLCAGDATRASQAALALGAIGDAAAVPELIALLDQRGVSFAAARALGGIGGPAAVEGLCQALAGADKGARSGAVKALRQLAAPQALTALIAALQDPTTSVRAEAARALGELGAVARPAIQALLAVWRDEQKIVREAAVQAVAQIDGLDSLPMLEKALDDGRTRRYAVQALGRLQSPRAVPALLRTMAVDGQQERVGAMRALCQIGQNTPAVEQTIKKALSDDSNWVRGEAARALRKLGRSRA